MEKTLKDESFGQKEQRIRQSFYSQLQPPDGLSQPIDIWVREIFDNYVIVESPQGLLKYSYLDADTGITFSDPIPVEEAFVSKGKLDRINSIFKSCAAMLSGTALRPAVSLLSKGTETQNILTKDVELKICSNDERLVGGLVLVPGEVDSQNDFWRAKDIRKVSLGFMEKSQVIDYMHTSLPIANVVESMYLPTIEEGGQEQYTLYGHDAPAGAWWITVKVFDDDAWNQVKSGDLTGFSIFGLKRASKKASVSKSAAGDAQAGARLMDGDEWDVTMVALVDKPAVSQATYYVVKRDGSGKPQFIDYKGRKISDETYKKLKDAYVSIGDLLSLADDERLKELIPIRPEKEARKMEVTLEEAQKAYDEAARILDEAKKAAGIQDTPPADADPNPVDEVQKALDALNDKMDGFQKRLDEIALKAEEKPEIPEDVQKRLEDIDSRLKVVAKKSNSLDTEDATVVKESGDLPDWANLSGGPRKRA